VNVEDQRTKERERDTKTSNQIPKYGAKRRKTDCAEERTVETEAAQMVLNEIQTVGSCLCDLSKLIRLQKHQKTA